MHLFIITVDFLIAFLAPNVMSVLQSFTRCHCNLLGDCFYSDRGVNGRKINNFLMIVKKSHTFMYI
jgi:hypothetical protein